MSLSYPPEVQARAAAFSARAIPGELQPNYVAGSLADLVIGAGARGQALDAELKEAAEIVALEYESSIAEAKTAELRDYWTEAQRLVSEVLAANS